MGRYVHPTRGNEPPASPTQRNPAAGHRALTRSTRAVTQSVAVVRDVLRSASRPAVFARGLMPSRLRRWSWKAGDLAWNIVGAIGVGAMIVVLAFLAYVLLAIAVDGVFG